MTKVCGRRSVMLVDGLGGSMYLGQLLPMLKMKIATVRTTKVWENPMKREMMSRVKCLSTAWAQQKAD